MAKVRPKKFLGQHFLKDERIAESIVQALTGHQNYQHVLEIGPGMGVLTKYLQKMDYNLKVVDLDRDSIAYLQAHFSELGNDIIEGDFLNIDWQSKFDVSFSIIGNFPYNISSQIFFRVLDMRQQIPEVVCMIQKEVAQRIASPPGNKTYGILSVLLKAFYDIEYLFTVNPGVFQPPPKVDSAVIRLKRNDSFSLDCDEKIFFRVVKQGFQNRRKTLRNALKPINLPPEVVSLELLNKRAEQLGVDDFIWLTKEITKNW